MLAKSRALAVDSVIYDLEDSVAPDAKATARELVAKCIADESMSATAPGRGPREVSVRINAVETGLALQDLTHVVCGFLLLYTRAQHSLCGVSASLGPSTLWSVFRGCLAS
jgi:citrate lyase beta subunit